MVLNIKKATCDRCGKECSHIVEKIFDEEACKLYNLKRKRIVENFYHYSEVSINQFDSRFEDSTPTNFTLCGECLSEFEEWLKIERK